MLNIFAGNLITSELEVNFVVFYSKRAEEVSNYAYMQRVWFKYHFRGQHIPFLGIPFVRFLSHSQASYSIANPFMVYAGPNLHYSRINFF